MRTHAAVFGQWVVGALLWFVARVCYVAGFLVGRLVVFALWCWVAVLEGFKAGV